MWRWWVCCNLKREAAPLATCCSDMAASHARCCNLKREAAPLATASTTTSYTAGNFVAISSEKPLPWRRHGWQGRKRRKEGLQSQARSRSPGDIAEERWGSHRRRVAISSEKPLPWRLIRRSGADQVLEVAISSEKPLPWRRDHAALPLSLLECCNLKREAAPLATHSARVHRRRC